MAALNKIRTPKGRRITAKQYLNLANVNGLPCEHGHLSCAAWDGGPCTDELLSMLESGDDFVFTDERD